MIYKRILRFGQFEVDADSGELRRQGMLIKLQDQPFRLLLALLERPGEVVTRDELRIQIWSADTFVDFDQSLSKAVGKLRDALGDDASNPRFIETPPKRGYRFIAPVHGTSSEVQPNPSRRERQFGRRLTAVVVAVLSIAGWAAWRAVRQTPRVVSIQQLTHDGRTKERQIATDGRHVVFSWSANRTPAAVSAEGGDAVTLPTELKGFPWDVSGNGQQLLLGEWRVDDPDAITYQLPLWKLTLPAGTPYRIGDLRTSGASWSPDGQTIAITLEHTLEVCQNDGSGQRRLATFRGWPTHPRWSPDGKTIRVLVGASRPPFSYVSSVWDVDAATGASREITLGPHTLLRPAFGSWLPDGKFLISLTAGGLTNVVVLPRGLVGQIRGDDLQKLTVGPVEFSGLTVAPDGKRVYAVGGQRRGEVMRRDSRSGELAPFGNGLSADGVEFSPDGNWIAWVAYPEGTLWRSRPDGSEKSQLIGKPLLSYLPRWSPDGTHLAVMVRAPGEHWRIRVMRATGGRAEVLVPGPGPEADPNWSPDGARIVYAPFVSDVPENSQAVFIIEVATRVVVKARGSDGLWSPRWSPDGRYIAACTRNGAQLKVLDLQTGESKLLVPRVTHFPAWSRDGRHIYCATPIGPEQEPAIVRVRVADGNIHVVMKLGSADRAGNIGPWVGLTLDEQPMILRDLRTEDIYALHLAR